MHVNRREMLASLALAVSPLGAAVAKEAAPLPIVDTHQHLWDLNRFRLPWLSGVPKVLSRSYVTSDFRKATAGLNVVKAVYMEVDVDPAQQVAEADHLIELCQSDDHPTVAAVISGRPNSGSFRKYITRYKNSPYIKGVRQVLHVPQAKAGLCLEDQFVKSVQLLGELGMSFDLCMRPTELGDAVRLADRCGDTRLIVDHCGNGDPMAFAKKPSREPNHKPGPWKRQISELAKRDNVVCKISGIIVRADNEKWQPDDLAPLVNHCLDEFGPDRTIFGGDWPVCRLVAEYREWVQALKAIISNRSRTDQRKLLHDNAVRLYGLS